MKLFKKLINSYKVRKLIFEIMLVIATIYIVFMTIFIGVGSLYKKYYLNKFEKQITTIHERNWELNEKNDEILLLENEYYKINLIAEVKNELNTILKDRRFFNSDKIDDEHLYHMEIERQKHNIPRHIYYRLIFMESGFNMYDNNGNVLASHSGAKGYMQLLKSTFNDIKHRYDLDVNNINNPYDNITAGTFYLKQRKIDVENLFSNTSEDYQWMLALSAYNAGIGKVIQSKGIPDIEETQKYVTFIMKDFSTNDLYASNLITYEN